MRWRLYVGNTAYELLPKNRLLANIKPTDALNKQAVLWQAGRGFS